MTSGESVAGPAPACTAASQARVVVGRTFPLTIYSWHRIYASMKLNAAGMERAAGAASELLKALANPHRLMIVCRLVDGERSVGQLAEALGLRDSTVSQHLALLRRDRLVSARRDGQTIWYSIASEPARAVLEALFRSYCVPGRSGGALPHAAGPHRPS